MRYPALEALDVLDPETMQPVPRDGETLGEVMFRGNVVMKGYLKNPKATKAAFAGGWFHSGDLGVRYPDGYVQLKDRSKDIIISGGENISSIEVEDALYKHPAVQAAAVVAQARREMGRDALRLHRAQARPERRRRRRSSPGAAGILAAFKCPRTVVFAEIAQDLDGQDPEIQAARDGAGLVSSAPGQAEAPASDGSRAQPALRGVAVHRIGKPPRQARQQLLTREAGLLDQRIQHVRADRLLEVCGRDLLIGALPNPESAFSPWPACWKRSISSPKPPFRSPPMPPAPSVPPRLPSMPPASPRHVRRGRSGAAGLAPAVQPFGDLVSVLIAATASSPRRAVMDGKPLLLTDLLLAG